MIEPAHHLTNVPCQACGAQWERIGDHSQLMDHDPDCAYIAWVDDVDDLRTFEDFSKIFKAGER